MINKERKPKKINASATGFTKAIAFKQPYSEKKHLAVLNKSEPRRNTDKAKMSNFDKHNPGQNISYSLLSYECP